MNEIPDDIWEAARGLRNAVCWQSNSAVEFIAKALNTERLAAEQRGREMERERHYSEKVCDHCDGRGWLTHSPYGTVLPCSECGGKGAIRSRTTEG